MIIPLFGGVLQQPPNYLLKNMENNDIFFSNHVNFTIKIVLKF